jgi:flagellar protein FlbD
MITLHRLGHFDEQFDLNPDLIVSIESTPDTVITLATNAKVVVADTPQEVATAIRRWRAEVLVAALRDDASGASTTRIRKPRAGHELAAIEGGQR